MLSPQYSPTIKLLLFWVVGILCTQFAPSLWLALVCLIFALVVLLAARLDNFSFDFFSQDLLSTSAIALLFILASALNCWWQQADNDLSNGGKQVMILQMEEPLVQKKNSKQSLLRICQTENDSLKQMPILVYLPKSTSDSAWQIGSCLLALVQLQRVASEGTPRGFNYAQFLAQQGIYYNCYLPEGSWQAVAAPPLTWQQHCKLWRQKLVHIYRSRLSAESYPLVAAIALGYREDLSKEHKAYFREAGIMHILAVSGLHVGIVCALLIFLLRPIRRHRWGKWVYAVLLLAGVWGYAVLTGLSPSVQRAAFMFSIFIIAYSLHQKNAIYNSIALSALILLVFSPKLLFDVGFQLSYGAVIAIVMLQPRLNSLIRPKTVVGRYAWDIITVSMAAQLGTAPLCLFYFHQFPLFFLLSNLLAIPAAVVILSWSLLSLLASPIPFLSDWLFSALQWVVHWFIRVFQQLSNLPYSSIKHIYVSKVELGLLLVGAGLVMASAWCARRKYLNWALGVFILVLALNTYDKVSRQNDRHVQRHQPTKPVWQLAYGSAHYILYTDSIEPPEYLYDEAIMRWRLQEPIFIYLAEEEASYHDAHLLLRDGMVQFHDTVFIVKPVE